MDNNKQILYILLGILISPLVLSMLIPFMLIVLSISLLNPLSETLTCEGIQCKTTANFIIGTSVQNEQEQIKNKNMLIIQTVPDAIGMNRYYIRTKDYEQYAFRTSYVFRANAERDLKKIQESYMIRIVKHNVVFINNLCITLYIILLIIGVLIKRKKIRNNKNHIIDIKTHNINSKN